MTLGEFLLAGWQQKPGVIGGCAIALGGYLALARPLGARAFAFAAGLLTLLLSLVSPLDTLAHTYLFSAHMAQHLLLTLVVPPLLLLGLPPGLVGRLLDRSPAGRFAAWRGYAPLAWALATATMWVWHLPALYVAALRDDRVHIGQHLLFLATAALYWWPVVAPAGARGALAPWAAALYLFTGMAASSVLGILLTFAPPGLYPDYLRPADVLGILPLVRDRWGLTPAADQQVGGLLMWIPGGFVYSLGLFGTLARWFAAPDEADDEPAPAGRAAHGGVGT